MRDGRFKPSKRLVYFGQLEMATAVMRVFLNNLSKMMQGRFWILFMPEQFGKLVVDLPIRAARCYQGLSALNHILGRANLFGACCARAINKINQRHIITLSREGRRLHHIQ